MLIRNVRKSDLDQVARIEQEVFSEPWSRTSFAEAMAREDNIFVVAESEGEVLGYALLYVTMDEGEIPTIATNPNYLRQGIGSKLMHYIIEESASKNVTQIFLEVRQSNVAAQGLYRGFGFQEVGLRKNFYRFPTEDAIVMRFGKEDIC